MAKQEFQFEDFLVSVNDECKDFVTNIHGTLSQDNYKTKIQSKAGGLFISYSHPKTKRSVLNFLFRKKELWTRIYADNCGKYSDVLNVLPEIMLRQIEKASPCKRLINPQECNAKCVLGYDFYIGEKHYQICRNSCFLFEVNRESIPYLFQIIENERKERNV